MDDRRRVKPKTRHGTMAIFPQAKKKPKKLASGSGKGPQRSFPSEGQQPKPRRKSGWQKRIEIGNVDVDPNMQTVPTTPPTNDDIDIHPNPKTREEIEKDFMACPRLVVQRLS